MSKTLGVMPGLSPVFVARVRCIKTSEQLPPTKGFAPKFGTVGWRAVKLVAGCAFAKSLLPVTVWHAGGCRGLNNSPALPSTLSNTETVL